MTAQTFATTTIPGTPARDAGIPPHVAAALEHVPHHAFAIDADHADTAAFVEAHQWPLTQAANTIVVVGKQADRVVYALCVVLASTKIDMNKTVRKALDVRKVSFAPAADAVAATGMEFGSITPFGAPAGWPILVDAGVTTAGLIAVGGGHRGVKLAVDGSSLAALPAAQVLAGLAINR